MAEIGGPAPAIGGAPVAAGLERRVIVRIVAVANVPHGLVLFAGATGSGKSTTMAALCRRVVVISWAVPGSATSWRRFSNLLCAGRER